jgi:hypothetical protein
MKPIYRVVKHTQYEKCEVKREYFTIQKQVKFLIWVIWKDIKETNCGMGDCSENAILFNTESEAIYAIKRLESGNIADGWKNEVTTVLDFNKKE